MNISSLLPGDRFGIGPRLARFFAWWGAELRALAPAGLERRLGGEQTEVRATVVDQRLLLTLTLTEADQPAILGELDLAGDSREAKAQALRDVISKRAPAGASLRVELSGAQVLSRDVFLPLATEHNLAQVLQFEMDRLTPFTAGQVGCSYRIVERLPARDRIKVRLDVVPRVYLLGLLEQLSPLGLTVSGVYIADAGGKHTGQSLNVLPEELRPVPDPLWNRKNRNLLLALLALLAIAMVLPGYWQNRQIARLEAEIASISADAARAAERQRLLAAHLEGQQVLSEKKNSQLAKLETIRTLTELLPSTTWVSKLTIDQDQVSIHGESSKSSDLIGILEQNEYFRNVEFTSPVTRSRASDKERYQIRLQLLGLAGGD